MKMKVLVVFITMLLSVFQGFSQLKSGDNIVIREKENNDLYVAGGTIAVDAPVHGDLIVVGGTITVNDSITQDILVVGGNIIFNGFVGDDIRCAGGKITLSSDVDGDVVVTGGTVNIDEGVVINGNLIASGGEITLDGEVKGLIKSASGTLTLNGKAHNDIDCRGERIFINGTVNGRSVLAANIIEVGSGAHFNQDVRYWNDEGALDFKASLSGAETSFDPSLKMDSGKWHYLGFASFLMVVWYLGTALVMIFLIQYLFGLIFKNSANTVKNGSLKSLGFGFLFLIGVPIVVVIAVATLIGCPLEY